VFKQAKALETFLKWVEQLKQHRLYRQHLLTFGTRDLPVIRAQGSTAEDDTPNRSSKFLLFVEGIEVMSFNLSFLRPFGFEDLMELVRFLSDGIQTYRRGNFKF
jgi:hypothetical protein